MAYVVKWLSPEEQDGKPYLVDGGTGLGTDEGTMPEKAPEWAETQQEALRFPTAEAAEQHIAAAFLPGRATWLDTQAVKILRLRPRKRPPP